MESPRVDHTHMERNLHDPYCSLDGKAPPILLVKTLQKRVIIVFGLPGMEMLPCTWLGSKLTSERIINDLCQAAQHYLYSSREVWC